MPAPLSDDLRKRVVMLYGLSGATYDYVAELLGIGRATVARVLRLQRVNGSISPKLATGGPPRRLSAAEVDHLAQLVAEKPDATLDELAEMWGKARPDKPVSRGTVSRRVREQGLTFKKKRSGPRKRTKSA